MKKRPSPAKTTPKERILAFGCHPDDVEFMCAGTLILLAERGYEIHIATMTGGEVGHPTLSKQQIRAKRLQEAENSARLIGGRYHYAGGCDLEVDVSSVMAKKEKMLACHESQREWLAYHNKWDAYTHIMKDWTRKQGECIGRPYGECFIQHLGNGHPQDNILTSILGARCVKLDADAK
jgi:LmbE family N-acetylglucosaminyl deacetylase